MKGLNSLFFDFFHWYFDAGFWFTANCQSACLSSCTQYCFCSHTTDERLSRTSIYVRAKGCCDLDRRCFFCSYFAIVAADGRPMSIDDIVLAPSLWSGSLCYCRTIFRWAVAAAAAAVAECSFGSVDWWWLWNVLHSTSVTVAGGSYWSLCAVCRSVAFMPASLQSVPVVLQIDRCIIFDYVLNVRFVPSLWCPITYFVDNFLLFYRNNIFRIEGERVSPGCCEKTALYWRLCFNFLELNIVFLCFCILQCIGDKCFTESLILRITSVLFYWQ